MKRDANYAAQIGRTLMLPEMGLIIPNGIAILSKKIVGYAEGVIEIFYITRPFPYPSSQKYSDRQNCKAGMP